jgi:hypothetical protein
MFTLNVPDLDASTGSIPVTWCLDLEGINEIMLGFKTEPTVLLIVAPSGSQYLPKRENRYVVPLKDLMTYISFKTPGENRIFAMVFNKSVKEIRKRFLFKCNNGAYLADVLNYDGSDFADHGDLVYTKYYKLSTIRTVINVNVPEDAFASPPSEWEMNWVLWILADKGTDQCAFRKRRILAYTIQPFFFACNYLIRIFLTFISASVALRSCTLKFLTSPLQTELSDCLELFHGESFLIRNTKLSLPDKDNTIKIIFKIYWHYIRRFIGLIFLPALWMILLPIIPIIGLKTFTSLCLTTLSLILVAMISLPILMVPSLLVKLLKSFFSKKEESNVVEKSLDKKASKPLFTAQDIEYISCNPIDTQASYVKIEALPSAKRTFRLRFQELKSKVCRPFPG